MKLYIKLIITLPFIFNMTSSFCQTKCDSTSKDIFFMTDEPPTMNMNFKNLENIINREIKITDYQIIGYPIIHLSLTINCKGEHFDYKVLDFKNQIFNERLIFCVMNNIVWTPARHRGMPVDFSYTFTIKLQKDLINILDKKEIKRLK